MTHGEAFSLLDAYLDGELDIATSVAIATHSGSCDVCREQLIERQEMASRVRTADLRYREPPGLRARVLRRVSPKRPWIAGRSPWSQALVAGLVLAIGGFYIGQSVSRTRDLGNEVVAAHVRSLLSTHVVDVVSSDHHMVKPWFAGKLPFAPPVPELADAGDALVGGRVEYLEHQRVAALVYQHGNHVINVFVWPRTGNGISLPAESSIDGYRVVSADAGRFHAAIASDMSIAELAAFCDRWTSAANR